MTYQWEPGTQYEFGTIVLYDGHRYKIIQPHTSQENWTPPMTPALWGRLLEPAPEYSQGQQTQTYEKEDEKAWTEQTVQKVEVHQEEQKRHWYDLDDHRKKQLLVGGGLAAGIALLGGGYYAYHAHQKSEEEKKAHLWGLQGWISDAQARSEEYHRNGRQNLITWVLVHDKNFPADTLAGGSENGQTLYIARAFHDGGIQVGKAGLHLEQGASIGYNEKEISFSTFEVLITDQSAVRWVRAYGDLKVEEKGYTLVEGGREDDGTPVYIARAEYNLGHHPGRVSAKSKGAYIAWGGAEICVNEYYVLAYA